MEEEQGKNAYYDELLNYDVRVGNHMAIAETISKAIAEVTALMSTMGEGTFQYSYMESALRDLNYAARENRNACFATS